MTAGPSSRAAAESCVEVTRSRPKPPSAASWCGNWTAYCGISRSSRLMVQRVPFVVAEFGRDAGPFTLQPPRGTGREGAAVDLRCTKARWQPGRPAAASSAIRQPCRSWRKWPSTAGGIGRRSCTRSAARPALDPGEGAASIGARCERLTCGRSPHRAGRNGTFRIRQIWLSVRRSSLRLAACFNRRDIARYAAGRHGRAGYPNYLAPECAGAECRGVLAAVVFNVQTSRTDRSES